MTPRQVDISIKQINDKIRYLQYAVAHGGGGGGGTGSVTSVSVASANGFAGSVATATSTPAITLRTSVTGILVGNGTSISEAVIGDFPTLNQNTTGSAATLSANLPISKLNSGTGASATTYWTGNGTWTTPPSNLEVVTLGTGTALWTTNNAVLSIKAVKNTTFISGATDGGDSSLLISLSASGTPSSSTYLRGDNTWSTLPASGITTLNTLTGATQTFATGTSGTDFAISSTSTTHTFNIPDASASARGFVSTGTQTFVGAKTLNAIVNMAGGFTTGTASAANIYVPNASAGGALSNANILFFGASSVMARIFETGTTSQAITANFSAASHVIGNQTFAEASSGTHGGIFSLVVKAPTITSGAATLTNAGTVYIEGAPTATATNPITSLLIGAGDATLTNGSLSLNTAGNKINIATGSNASVGVSGAMTAGTITISTTAVTANSIIFLTHATIGGTQGILSVGTKTAGTSFVINSSNAADTGTVNWLIIN